MLAVIELFVSVGSNIKWEFALATLVIVSATYILMGELSRIIAAAAVFIMIFILSSFARGFVSAISPSNTFRLLKNCFNREEEARFKMLRLDDEIRDKPPTQLSPAQIEKCNNVLQNTVIYNRAMLFYARTMRDYQRSNLLFLPGLFTILRLASPTVVGLTLINLAA